MKTIIETLQNHGWWIVGALLTLFAIEGLLVDFSWRWLFFAINAIFIATTDGYFSKRFRQHADKALKGWKDTLETLK